MARLRANVRPTVLPRFFIVTAVRHLRVVAVGAGIIAAVAVAVAAPAEAARNHWAFQALRRPAVPVGVPAENGIDAFVRAGLDSKGLIANPPAEPRELVRRVYLDLVGLPPSPEEVAAFAVDPSPAHFARVVEHLLALPQYGERWGRHWLDVARYTESTGFEYDRLRENAWPYRDYVIQSFNEDKPYHRFMQEQVAGDVLEPVTRAGIVGASLLVSGPYDQAGNAQANATQRAITREEEMEDLLSVVGQTFLGLTINCARCHDHKFDPIPQVDYYRVKSVFDGVKHGERSTESAAETQAREARAAESSRRAAEVQETVSRLERAGLQRALAAQPLAPQEPGPPAYARWMFDGTTNSVLPGKARDGARIAGGQLQLPKAGAFFQTDSIPRDIREKTLEAWVSLADLHQGGGAAISIESTDGSHFDAIVFGERQAGKWTAGSEGFVRTHDQDAAEETATAAQVVHVAIAYRADNSVALYRNGEPYGKPYTPASPLQIFKTGDAHLLLGMRHRGGGRPWLTGAIRQSALYDRALSDAEIAASFRAGGFTVPQEEILARLTPEERQERETALAAVKQARESAAAWQKPQSIAYAGTRVEPPPTRVLLRGDVKSPGDVVRPSGLSVVAGVPSDFGLAADAPEAQRRRHFAVWLADPRNPLPARVMANRVWQWHFGQGLVATPSDFGINGARPTHPELLDWLASRLVESGWSVKALHRLIMNSDTYRRSSWPQASALAKDADNQFWWRYSPRRLEAEVLRDAILSVSGQINLQLGGPSFRPFTTTDFNATFYHPFDKGDAEFNRRTVYRMNINSGKEPLLDAFDCPDPSVKTPRRNVTTTPLQALGLMNSSFVQRQSGHLADRAMSRAQGDPVAAVREAYRLTLGRVPSAAEWQRVDATVKERGVRPVCWALLNSTEFVYAP